MKLAISYGKLNLNLGYRPLSISDKTKSTRTEIKKRKPYKYLPVYRNFPSRYFPQISQNQVRCEIHMDNSYTDWYLSFDNSDDHSMKSWTMTKNLNFSKENCRRKESLTFSCIDSYWPYDEAYRPLLKKMPKIRIMVKS